MPFVELPALCENQLIGADAEHWQALLNYVQVSGIVHSDSSRNAPEQPRRDLQNWPTDAQHRGGYRREQGLTGQRSTVEESEEGIAQAGGAGGGRLTRGESMPALGLLLTAAAGGCHAHVKDALRYKCA